MDKIPLFKKISKNAAFWAIFHTVATSKSAISTRNQNKLSNEETLLYNLE
jgi:hypothetical protein